MPPEYCYIDEDNEKLLIEAASLGNYEEVIRLLEAGTSVDATEYNTALFYASKNYLTPLQLAAKGGHTKCVDILIAHCADVNAKNCFDVTALHLAAENGHVDCVKSLLEANAECSPPTKYSKPGYYTAVPYLGGTTPLHLAAKNNHVNCVAELMRHGADYNAVDQMGHTSLYIAAKLSDSDCILAHLKNAYGRGILSLPSLDTSDTPLHHAVRRGFKECVSELLKFGSDANHKNYDGDSPLHITLSMANKRKGLELLKILVLEGNNVDVNQRDKHYLTPLDLAYFGNSPMCPNIVKFLLSYGANVDLKNGYGLSILQHELRNSSDKLLKYVVRNLLTLPKLETLKGNPRIPPHLMPRRLPRMRMQEPADSSAGATKCVWYKEISTQPRTLQHSCRHAIRRAMSPYSLKNVSRLNVPNKLQSYVLLEHGD